MDTGVLADQPHRRASKQQSLSQPDMAGTCPEKRPHDDGSYMAQKQRRTGDIKERRFACPFVKLFPTKQELPRACRGNGFSSIARVKEHISRSHLRFSCPVCHEMFESKRGRDAHIVIRKCPSKTNVDPCFIDEDKMASLRGRKKELKSLDREDQWFHMWKVLFPDSIKPPSPFADQTTSATSNDIRTIFSTMRPRLLSSLMTRLPADVSPDDLDTLIKECFDQALDDCMEYGSEASSLTSTPILEPVTATPQQLMPNSNLEDADTFSSANPGITSFQYGYSAKQEQANHALSVNALGSRSFHSRVVPSMLPSPPSSHSNSLFDFSEPERIYSGFDPNCTRADDIAQYPLLDGTFTASSMDFDDLYFEDLSSKSSGFIFADLSSESSGFTFVDPSSESSGFNPEPRHDSGIRYLPEETGARVMIQGSS